MSNSNEGCDCCQSGVSRIDVGYVSGGGTVRIPSHFLRSDGYYIMEDGYPYIPNYIIGPPELNQYPIATEQDVFFLDSELTMQFQMEHLKRKSIFSDSDNDEEAEEAEETENDAEEKE